MYQELVSAHLHVIHAERQAAARGEACRYQLPEDVRASLAEASRRMAAIATGGTEE